MKKGFTMVELLAVIIILGILMVLAVPQVLGQLRNIKESAFISEVQEMYRAAAQQYTINRMLDHNIKCFNSSQAERVIEASGEQLVYKIYINDVGSMTSAYVYSPTQRYEYYNDNITSIEDISPSTGTLNANVLTPSTEYFTDCPAED